MFHFKNKKAEDGLTLVELLVVIALVGVVAGIALPIVSNVLAGAQNDASAASATNQANFTRDWTAAGATFESDADNTYAVVNGKTVAQISNGGGNGGNNQQQQTIFSITTNASAGKWAYTTILDGSSTGNLYMNTTPMYTEGLLTPDNYTSKFPVGATITATGFAQFTETETYTQIPTPAALTGTITSVSVSPNMMGGGYSYTIGVSWNFSQSDLALIQTAIAANGGSYVPVYDTPNDAGMTYTVTQ